MKTSASGMIIQMSTSPQNGIVTTGPLSLELVTEQGCSLHDLHRVVRRVLGSGPVRSIAFELGLDMCLFLRCIAFRRLLGRFSTSGEATRTEVSLKRFRKRSPCFSA